MSQSAAKDFDAVVLALDFDSPLSSFTDHAPPSFLPVANRPLICFQLEYLFKSGIERVHIITSSALIDALKSIIDVNFRWLCPSAAEKIVCIPVNANDTATALREARDLLAITRDFFLIAGDVITNISLDTLISVHQYRGAIATILTQARPPAVATPEGKIPPELDIEDLSRDIYALDPSTNRVLYARSLADLQDDVILPKQVMDSHPDALFTGALDTAYMYLLSPVVFNLLDEKTDFVDIRSELVPYLIATQFDPKSRGYACRRHVNYERSGAVSPTPADTDSTMGLGLDAGQGNAERKSSDLEDEEEDDALPSPLQLKPATGSVDAKDDPVRVYMVVAPPAPKAYLTRVATVEAYLGLNKTMIASSAVAAAAANTKAAAEAAAEATATGVALSTEATAAAAATSTISSGSAAAAVAGPWTPTISQTTEYSIKASVPRVTIVDSRFGENVQVGKCTIINSVIGHRVVLKEGCNVRNSIIMDDCTIEMGAQIHDSVVCNHAVIQTKSQLKKCTVRKNCVVEEGEKHENADL